MKTRKESQKRDERRRLKYLSPQEEEFCRLIAKESCTQQAAYMQAYGCDNKKYAREQGCELRKREKIKKRIEELQKQISLKANFTAEDAFKEAQVVQEMCLQANDRKGYMEALNMKINLCGLYAPKQSVQASVNATIPVSEQDMKAVLQNVLNGGNQLKIGDGK